MTRLSDADLDRIEGDLSPGTLRALVAEVRRLKKKCDLLAMEGASDASAMWEAEAEVYRLRDGIRQHRDDRTSDGDERDERLWALLDGQEQADG